MNLGSKEVKTYMDTATCMLLDIEGTTTSIDFVRKDLLTYVIQNIHDYVVHNWDDAEVQNVVRQLLQNKEDGLAAYNSQMRDERLKDADAPTIQEIFINKLKTEMTNNQKSNLVKELEGLVCMKGFIKGELIGHIYSDVVDALKVWSSQEKKIYIYSNGSIQSQRLLFSRNIHGDLSKYIDGNFDTSIGSKLDSTSYSKICQAIEKLPSEVVFFSDRPRELFAAKQAGLNIVLVVRNPECQTFADEMSYLKPNDPTINSFLDVLNIEEKEN